MEGDVSRPQSSCVSYSAESVAYQRMFVEFNFVFPYISQMLSKGFRRFVVNSANPGEGKSTLIWQVSKILAEAGVRTLVIDGDLHNPTLSRQMKLLVPQHPHWEPFQLDTKIPWFGFDPGVVTSSQEASRENQKQDTANAPGVALQKLLSNPGIPTILGEFECVLFDSPPHLLKNDVFALGKLCDGAIMVVSKKHFRGLDSLQLVEFKEAELSVVGVILTQDPIFQQSPLSRALVSLGLRA